MIQKTLVLLILLGLGTFAYAHGWYPPECCSDADCRSVDCDLILETATGYVYDGIQFTKESMKLSKDALCHACFRPNQTFGLCLFGQFGN